MTVQTQTAKVTANGNDSATTFSFSPIVIFASTDLEVTHVDSAGTETLLTEGSGASNYSVTVSQYPGTGSITYPADEVTPLPSGESLVIKRVLTLEQQTDLENQGGYNPDTLEQQLDKGIMIDLQQQEELDRAIKLLVSVSGVTVELPSPAASQLIGWNSGATGFENYAPNSQTYFTTPLGVSDGGTGAATAAAARSGLGIAELFDYQTLAPHKNLRVLSATAATVDIDADRVYLRDGSDTAYEATSVNLTVDITASGANGLDTGAEANSTIYYLWVIYNETTVAGLISASATAPTMPSGYTYKGLVGSFFNDASGNIDDFYQLDDVVETEGRNVLVGGTQTTWTAIDVQTHGVPSIAREIHGNFGVFNTSVIPSEVFLSSRSDGAVGNLESQNFSNQGNYSTCPFRMPYTAAPNIYYKNASGAGTPTSSVTVTGFRY